MNIDEWKELKDDMRFWEVLDDLIHYRLRILAVRALQVGELHQLESLAGCAPGGAIGAGAQQLCRCSEGRSTEGDDAGSFSDGVLAVRQHVKLDWLNFGFSRRSRHVDRYPGYTCCCGGLDAHDAIGPRCVVSPELLEECIDGVHRWGLGGEEFGVCGRKWIGGHCGGRPTADAAGAEGTAAGVCETADAAISAIEKDAMWATDRIFNGFLLCFMVCDMAELDLNFDSDGKSAAVAEGLLRDLEDGRGLLPLVLAAFDERKDAADEADIDSVSGSSALSENLFGGAVALDISLRGSGRVSRKAAGSRCRAGRDAVRLRAAW